MININEAQGIGWMSPDLSSWVGSGDESNTSYVNCSKTQPLYGCLNMFTLISFSGGVVVLHTGVGHSSTPVCKKTTPQGGI